MRQKRKSRAKILNRIILVQTILLTLLIGVIINKNSKATVNSFDSYLTPTPQIQVGTDPIQQIQSDSNTAQQIQSDSDTIPQIQSDSNVAPTLTIQPTGTLIPTIEPTITPTQVVSQSEDENIDSIEQEMEEITSTDSEDMNENVPVFARGMSQEFISSLSNTQEGTILEAPGIPSITFYMQTDSRWASSYYGGTDTIEEYGCGPTSLSIVISSLTDTKIDPVQMCAWAYEKGYWFSGQGSLHNLIPEAATAFGLNVIGVQNIEGVASQLRTALLEGKLVIALMGKGNFTRSGHFIVLRGITEDDMVYVADPNSQENTEKTWKLTQIVNEAKSWAGANGPFWVIGN